MIDVIWCFMLVVAVVYALMTGSLSQVSAALFEGAKSAVSLTITLLGTMGFWLGITEIAEKSGMTKGLQRLMLPVIHRLFPEFRTHPAVNEKISLNLTANLLGLGNAATPLGLAAMDEMEKLGKGRVPSRGMILFVVINTASLQLLPTQMAALRSAYGSAAPFGILPEVWAVSAGVMALCVTFCKVLESRHGQFNR